MQEKAIKKSKTKEIDISSLESTVHNIEVNEAGDYFIKYIVDSERLEDHEISFVFKRSDVEANIFIRALLKARCKVKLAVKVITPNGIKGVSSELDMRALVLHDESSIEFVPILEIDEMDVSVDHHSTVGAPDPEIIWYMNSRGLDSDVSKELLAQSFLS